MTVLPPAQPLVGSRDETQGPRVPTGQGQEILNRVPRSFRCSVRCRGTVTAPDIRDAPKGKSQIGGPPPGVHTSLRRPRRWQGLLGGPAVTRAREGLECQEGGSSGRERTARPRTGGRVLPPPFLLSSEGQGHFHTRGQGRTARQAAPCKDVWVSPVETSVCAASRAPVCCCCVTKRQLCPLLNAGVCRTSPRQAVPPQTVTGSSGEQGWRTERERWLGAGRGGNGAGGVRALAWMSQGQEGAALLRHTGQTEATSGSHDHALGSQVCLVQAPALRPVTLCDLGQWI